MIRDIHEDTLRELRRPRNPQSHKNTYGNALLVAGSYGMMGAALLAARACMRSGVGLLTVRVPRCGYTILQLGLPEAKCSTDACEEHHTAIEVPRGVNALAIGPGLGLHEETKGAVLELLYRLRQQQTALVVDADALNILSLHPQALEWLPQNTILTPHLGEARRLLQATGISDCQQLAIKYNIIVILKGSVTLIYLPDGDVWRNAEHGNAGMAVGGSGDTLTGILLGLRAQGYSAEKAAVLGVGLHALAADLAITEGTESMESLLPSDLTAWLGRAFRH